jgi:hypothetical protein
MESSFETRLKILESNYESRVRTLESEHLMPRNKVVNEGNWGFNTNGSSGGSSSNTTQIIGNFNSFLNMGEVDVRMNNPLAEMGLSDEHSNMIFQNVERFTGMGTDDVVGGCESGSGSGGVKRTV